MCVDAVSPFVKASDFYIINAATPTSPNILNMFDLFAFQMDFSERDVVHSNYLFKL